MRLRAEHLSGEVMSGRHSTGRRRNLTDGPLSFSTDVGMAVRESDIIFIEVQVHAPEAMRQAQFYLGRRVTYAPTNYDATKDADALVILTEWQPCPYRALPAVLSRA